MLTQKGQVAAKATELEINNLTSRLECSLSPANAELS